MNITVNNFAVLFTLKEKAEQEQERLRQSALNAPDTSTPTSKPVSSSLGEDLNSTEDIPTAKDTDTAKESEKEKVKTTEKVVEKVAVKEKEQDSETDTDTGKESTIEKSRAKGVEKDKEKASEKQDASDSEAGVSSSSSSTSTSSKTAGKEPVHSKPLKDGNGKAVRTGEHSGHASPTDNGADGDRRMLSDGAATFPYKIGFILRRAPSESSAQQDLEQIIERGERVVNKQFT